MLEVTYAALWIAVALQGFFICFLVRELAELRQLTQSGTQPQVDGLPVGSKAPDFEASDVRSGNPIRGSSMAGRDIAILLLTPECGECRRLTSQLKALPASLAAKLIVFCHGPTRRCQHILSKVPDSITVVINEEMDLAAVYQVRGFPALFVVDARWRIAGHGYPYQVSDIERILNASPPAFDRRAEDEPEAGRLDSLPGEVAPRVS